MLTAAWKLSHLWIVNVVNSCLVTVLYNHHVLYLSYNSSIPFAGKIRLLDVGSCYNPFQAFAEFCAVGIDIAPALNVSFWLFICIFGSFNTC